MKKALLHLFALSAFALVVGCRDTNSVMSARLEHISAGTLVHCDQYSDQSAPQTQHTCLALTNPFLPMLRIYDVTDGQFLFSPIGYSPLAVRSNGMTVQLTSFDKPASGFVFALDANTSQIAAFNARNSGAVPSFSVAQAPPTLSPATRVQKFFVLASATNPISTLAALENGHVNLATFDTTLNSFGAIQDIDLAVNGQILDAVYDQVSGLMAFLVQTATDTRVVVRQSNNVGNATLEQVFENVGRVKIALGSINTSTAAAPHLLLMDQDSGKIGVRRLDPDTLAVTLSNDIMLSGPGSMAYFPQGANKAPCCSGMTEWLSVGSDTGFIYYLLAADLLNTEKDKVFGYALDVAVDSGIGRASANGLVAFIGGDTVQPANNKDTGRRVVCARQMYFIYSAGFVGSVCEGLPAGVSVLVTR